MNRPIITLTTDFGSRDPYLAEMKAIILSVCADARIVDVSHEIEKHNVRMGAFTLACAAPYFPKRTIHVAVVDPGVGTERQPLMVQTSNGYYVGPDNGILALAIRNDGGAEDIRKITNSRFMRPKVSNTFHGRDIFAPAAAYLANGTSLAKFGPKISKMRDHTSALVTKRPGALVGEVIYIDDFGNIVTNLQPEDIQNAKRKSTIDLKIKNTVLNLKLCEKYAEVPPHKPLALFGSHNFLEISLNRDNAAKAYRTKQGDEITILLVEEH